MGFFDWAAPVFARFGDRWSPADTEAIAGWLRPAVPEGGRVLDVGGGTGALAARIADAIDAKVVVLDPTLEMLRYLPERDDVIGVHGLAEDMPFDGSSFDAVVVSDAFHHFRDQDAAVAEFVRVVRPGGPVLILELDTGGLFGPVLVAGERILGEPGSFFTPQQLCAYMAERGLPGNCARTRGLGYRFLGEVAKPE